MEPAGAASAEPVNPASAEEAAAEEAAEEAAAEEAAEDSRSQKLAAGGTIGRCAWADERRTVTRREAVH